MLLRLRVHIRRTDRNDGRTAVADLLALLVELLAERLGEQLNVPLGDGLQIVAIGHHDLDVAAVFLGCRKFQRGVEHRGILPEVVILTSLVHVTRPREEALNIKADARGERQPDLGKDGEASAHAVRHSELLPAHIHRELFEQRRLLLVRVGDRDHLNLDIVRLHERIVHHHEVRHRIERAARLRDDEQHDTQRLSAMRFLDLRNILHVVDDVARAARVDVVAAEVDARIVVSLLVRERVPELAAVHVEQYLVPEEGAADAE